MRVVGVRVVGVLTTIFVCMHLSTHLPTYLPVERKGTEDAAILIPAWATTPTPLPMAPAIRASLSPWAQS